METSCQANGLHDLMDSSKIFGIEPYGPKDCLDCLGHRSVRNGISLGGIVVDKAIKAMKATLHRQVQVGASGGDDPVPDTWVMMSEMRDEVSVPCNIPTFVAVAYHCSRRLTLRIASPSKAKRLLPLLKSLPSVSYGKEPGACKASHKMEASWKT